MEEKNKQEAKVKPKKKSRAFLAAVITFFLSAVIFGGSVYLWQEWESNGLNGQEEKSLQAYLKGLDELQTKIKEKDIIIKKQKEEQEVNKAEEVKLPVITYERAGLLTAEAKSELEQKLINPFLDYYNEKETTYITLVITVPRDTGEQYEVTAVHKDGSYLGFLFGARDEEYDWWAPECMDPCEFSDAYKEKYPDVVKKEGPGS